MPNHLPIEPIGPKGASLDPRQLRTPSPAPEGESTSFLDSLTDAVGEVQRLQQQADTTIRQVVSGEIKDITEAMVQVEKADVAFQTLLAVRNKIVAAYEEVMRMQV
jgi:flagellar hook-basal body complex protein FliE